MNNEEIEKIIYAVTKELEHNYDKYKIEHFGLADRTLIAFATIRSSSRVARSEGTDEDRDVILCYDEDGWFIYVLTVQVGAGIQKVISASDIKISRDEVLKKFEQLNLLEKMNFISCAYKILSFSESRTYLY